MLTLILAATLSLPIPPLVPTLGTGTPAPVVSISETTQLPASGLATYYAEGVFERVLDMRGIAEDACSDCDGWAALLWPGDMGRTVCVQGLRLLVVDVAARHHRDGLIARNWIVDIDPASWAALGYPNAPTKTTVTECWSDELRRAIGLTPIEDKERSQ